MQAKSRKQYVESWQSHVKELAALAVAASTPETFSTIHDQYRRIRDELFEWIETAADQQGFYE